MNKSLSFIKLMFTAGLFFIFVGLAIIRQNDIISIINSYFTPKNSVTIKDSEKNEYYRDYDFEFVQNTDNFLPTNYQEILNVYYTVINSGLNTFTFYCPKKYEECLTTVDTLANDQGLLSDINNFVHPFNGFSHIETEYDSLGRVTINITKTYTNEEINQINARVDVLYEQLVNNSLSMEDNILKIHDFVINNTKYDSERSDQNIVSYKSDTAYGPLFEGYGLCGGYTDLMELFLEKLKIKSYKISSERHIWNAVYINDQWKHLDLTWDDPVSNEGINYLEHSYFLIDTANLLSIETTQHIFNQDIYKELKEA